MKIEMLWGMIQYQLTNVY